MQWEPEGIGLVRTTRPGRWRVEQVDLDWPARRPAHHSNTHWKWTLILEQSKDPWGVVDSADFSRTLVLWSSERPRLTLSAGTFYELAWFEVDPALRNTRLAVVAVGLAAHRVLELDAAGLLLPSLPETVGVWTDFGAAPCGYVDYDVPEGAVPMIISRAILVTLSEAADEVRKG